jgi:hypothetical protein
MQVFKSVFWRLYILPEFQHVAIDLLAYMFASRLRHTDIVLPRVVRKNKRKYILRYEQVRYDPDTTRRRNLHVFKSEDYIWQNGIQAVFSGMWRTSTF